MRQLQGRLTTQRHHHAAQLAARGERVAHVQHSFDGQRLEEEAVAGVVIGRDGFGVAVDHHGFEPGVGEREGRVDAAVVELHALADPVRTAPENHHRRSFERCDLTDVLVGAVVIRGGGFELRRAGVDGLVRDVDARGAPDRAHQLGRLVPEIRELTVAEAEALRPPPGGSVQVRGPDETFELDGRLDDLGHLVEEPRIDPGDLVQSLDRDAAPEGHADGEQPIRRRGPARAFEVLDAQVDEGRVSVIESGTATLQRSQRLLQRLGEGAADGHHFADRLHHRAEHRVGTGQLLKCPARNLGHDVVDGRFEARGRDAGDVVDYLVQPVPDGELRGDLRDRESRRLAGERTRTRDARVHLDDHHLAVRGIETELHVRAAGLHADAPDARERGVSHLLVLDVGERLRGGDCDRVAGVHPHRIHVLDRADHHHVVCVVTHDLELVFLPAEHGLFEEDFLDRAGREAAARHRAQLVFVVGEPGPTTAENEAWTTDEREAHLLAGDHRSFDGVVHARGLVGDFGVGEHDVRHRHVQPDLLHRGLEPAPVLRGVDRLDARTDQLDVELFEHPGFVERDREVERGLTAERREQRVRTLPLDHAAQTVDGEGFDVGGVGEIRVGHDRRRVGVHQDHPVALLAQDSTRLRARVVELARLADDDRPAADQQDRFDVGALGHVSSRP